MSLARWYSVQSLMHPARVEVFETLLAVALLLTAAWCCVALLRSASPAVRHLMWALSAAGALALPAVRVVRGLSSPTVMSWSGDAAVSGGGGLDWTLVLAVSWGVGAAILISRLAHGSWMLRSVLRRAEKLKDRRWLAAFDLVGRAGSEILVSSEVGSPFAAGIVRPCIVVPASLLECAHAELHAILIHEAAHLRRRDPFVTLVALITRAVFWPLPMAWALVRGVALESERACDALVIASGVDRPGYVRQLMSLDGVRPVFLRQSHVHGLGQSQLYRRLEAICRGEGATLARRSSLAWTVVLVSATVVGLSGLRLPTVELGFVLAESFERLTVKDVGDVEEAIYSFRPER